MFLPSKIGLKEIFSKLEINHLEPTKIHVIGSDIIMYNKDMHVQEITILKPHLSYTYLFVIG